jgi:hypothetical protein
MGLNRRLERRLEVVLPLGSRPAWPGRLQRRRFTRACGGRGCDAGSSGEADSSRKVDIPPRGGSAQAVMLAGSFCHSSPFTPTTSRL